MLSFSMHTSNPLSKLFRNPPGFVLLVPLCLFLLAFYIMMVYYDADYSRVIQSGPDMMCVPRNVSSIVPFVSSSRTLLPLIMFTFLVLEALRTETRTRRDLLISLMLLILIGLICLGFNILNPGVFRPSGLTVGMGDFYYIMFQFVENDDRPIPWLILRNESQVVPFQRCMDIDFSTICSSWDRFPAMNISTMLMCSLVSIDYPQFISTYSYFLSGHFEAVQSSEIAVWVLIGLIYMLTLCQYTGCQCFGGCQRDELENKPR